MEATYFMLLPFNFALFLIWYRKDDYKSAAQNKHMKLKYR